MNATEISDLKLARKIVFSKLEGRPSKVYLFGSQARGDTWRASDIDIAIDAGGPLPQELLAEIADALEESDIIYRVDVVDFAAAPEALRRRILEEGIWWSG